MVLLLCLGLTPTLTRAQSGPDATLESTPITTPTPAPGTIPTEGAVSVPFLVYVPVGVLAALLIGALVFGGRLMSFLAILVPPDTAAKIYQDGVRFGFQIALNQAAQTPGTLDDEFFEEMARLRGLTVTRRADGSYDVQSGTTAPSATRVVPGPVAPLVQPSP